MSDSRYRVVLTSRAKKDLKNLRHHLDKALEAITGLEMNPYAGHQLKEYLSDCRSLEFNLRGSGAYRAVYLVNESNVVCVVFLVAAHENVYEEAKRRVSSARRSLDDL
jgi:mRNA-degrading endonuclease RelE of RelBE toxin-antitoxin system